MRTALKHGLAKVGIFPALDMARRLPHAVRWLREGCTGPAPPPIKRRIITAYLERYQIREFIETGTHLGDTLALAGEIRDPVFYLFCTVRKPIESNLNLPGQTIYVTHDDGFAGEIERLWLLSQFRTHIISHSSFYWWGTWIAERNIPDVRVHAHNLFNHSLPSRWIQYA